MCRGPPRPRIAGHADEGQSDCARVIRGAGRRLRGETLGQKARAVERRELVIAADRLAVDRHERHRPSATQVVHALAEARIVIERHLLVGEAASFEQRLRTDAVAAPFRRVEADPGHQGHKRLQTPFYSVYTAGSHGRSGHAHSYTGTMARSTTTEAVVLRSFRLGEADRILHLYTHERGRVGAVAKGVRKTKSRFGGRLEPFSHVELVLHQGRGELDTVTGASLIRSHDRIRSEPYRLQVGMIGLEAMLKLFTEQEANEKAFTALTRFLDALDDVAVRPGSRAALDPVVLSFQLKLLWVSGYMPHLETCVECGSAEPLVAFVPSAGGGACVACDPGGISLSPEGVHGMRLLLHSPIAAASTAGLGDRAQRDALAVVTASYEHHGGFRLKTVSA
jgi:DNA repair protein RecO (recombination protein O)